MNFRPTMPAIRSPCGPPRWPGSSRCWSPHCCSTTTAGGRSRIRWRSPSYKALEGALAAQPENEDLKSRFRALDERLRHEYFRQRRVQRDRGRAAAGRHRRRCDCRADGGHVAAQAAAAAAAGRAGRSRYADDATSAVGPSWCWPSWPARLAVDRCCRRGSAATRNSRAAGGQPAESPARRGRRPANAQAGGKDRVKTNARQDRTPADGESAEPRQGCRQTMPKPIADREAAPVAADDAAVGRGNRQGLAAVPRPGRRGHLGLHEHPRPRGTAPKARTSSGRRPCRCPATTRRWSGATACSSPAPTEKQREVYCFDAADGKLLWQKDVPGTPAEHGQAAQDQGRHRLCRPDDGHRRPPRFAIFANGDLAAFDFDGKLAWSAAWAFPRTPTATPRRWRCTRTCCSCSSTRAQAKDEQVEAAGARRGHRQDRLAGRPRRCPTPGPRRSSIHARRPRPDHHRRRSVGHRLRSGRRQGDLAGEVPAAATSAPRPRSPTAWSTWPTQFPALSAIRADGQGDVTETHILWKGEDGLPDTCSPLATEEYVFLLASDGTLTCYDAEEGRQCCGPRISTAQFHRLAEPGRQAALPDRRQTGKALDRRAGATRSARRVAEADLGEEVRHQPRVPGRPDLSSAAKNICSASGK